MAINLAEKYSTQVDERFALGSLTSAITNQDYDFIGTETVKVYSIETAPMGNYTRSGANRYGTPTELGDSVQELKLTKDRGFTYTIDRGNYDQQMMIKESGKSLQRQLDEVVIPEIDKYRLSVMSANAGNSVTASADIYKDIVGLGAKLTNAKAPIVGRVIEIGATGFSELILSPSFIKQSDLGQQVAFTGQAGMVDGMPVIVVPDDYLVGAKAIISIKPATVAPVTLSEYKIHEDAPGVSGWLVEGRVIYDAFVLNNKKSAVGVIATA